MNFKTSRAGITSGQRSKIPSVKNSPKTHIQKFTNKPLSNGHQQVQENVWEKLRTQCLYTRLIRPIILSMVAKNPIDRRNKAPESCMKVGMPVRKTTPISAMEEFNTTTFAYTKQSKICYIQTDTESITHSQMHGEIQHKLIQELKTRKGTCLSIDTMVPKYSFHKKYKTVIPEREQWKDVREILNGLGDHSRVTAAWVPAHERCPRHLSELYHGEELPKEK